MTPSYGGSPIFGYATEIGHIPNANAQQVAAFFGVQGVQSLMGGGRGRIFPITGILTGLSPAVCVANEQFLLTYADGVARTLIDTTGFGWANVIFKAEYQRESIAGTQFFYIPAIESWGMKYRCVFIGLT